LLILAWFFIKTPPNQTISRSLVAQYIVSTMKEARGLDSSLVARDLNSLGLFNPVAPPNRSSQERLRWLSWLLLASPNDFIVFSISFFACSQFCRCEGCR
jgi:hypothetical protein